MKAIKADGEFKKVPLDPRVPDRAIGLGTEIGPEEQAKLLAFHDKNNDVLWGQTPTSWELAETSLSTGCK
jgi:hypothetical protein